MSSLKSKITYRVEPNTWFIQSHFDNFYKVLEQYQDQIDEISLFINFSHSAMPLDYYRKMVSVAKGKIEKIKTLGISCGINHLTTIGHHRENDRGSLTGDYGRHIMWHGHAPGDLCVSDPNVIEYIKESYKILAEAKPDYIWMDDDVGMTHHYNCFCDRCIKLFNEYLKEIGFDLEYPLYKLDLIKKMETDISLRKAWYDFYTGKVNNVIKVIREAIDEVDKNIVLGLMSADYDYEETDKGIQSDIMSRNGEIETKWRPGCGVYKDHLTEWYNKAQLIGRLVRDYPPYVTDIQSEIENFPYNHLQKSVKFNVMETCAYMGAGCTGVAYNTLNGNSAEALYDSCHENLRRFELLKYRPFFDLIALTMGREASKGVLFVQKDKKSLWPKESGERWLDPSRVDKPSEIFFNGFPQAYKEGVITLLYGNEASNLKDEEILQILKGGVCMDTETLTALTERGFGEYLGFEVDSIIERDGIEKFNSHPINEGFENVQRDARMSFWRDGQVATIKKTSTGAQYLSTLVNYVGDTPKECSGVYENFLGGRVCVFGYYPNMYVQSFAESTRLKRLFVYLSNNKINYIKSYHKMVIFQRGEGIMLISSCLDIQKKVEIALCGDFDEIVYTNQDMAEKSLVRQNKDDFYSYFVIDEIEPFEIGLLRYKG